MSLAVLEIEFGVDDGPKNFYQFAKFVRWLIDQRASVFGPGHLLARSLASQIPSLAGSTIDRLGTVLRRWYPSSL